MSATETGLTALERNWAMVDRALEDLDDGIIAARPNEDSNSIGWLLWHMNRVVDRFIHTWCQDAPQVWIKSGWHAKFGLGDDINETGAGWTKEQVAAWQLPAKESLEGYYEEVKAAAREYLGGLSPAGFERPLEIPPRPPGTVGSLLGTLVFDNCVHGGQIAYLRGFYRGMGWFV